MSDLDDVEAALLALKGVAYDFNDETREYCERLLNKIKNMIDPSDVRDAWVVAMLLAQFAQLMADFDESKFDELRREECEPDVSDT